MRFGVVGYGSMGKRRARDLSADGHEVLVFDLREDRMREAAGGPGFSCRPTLEALLAEDLSALVISTPPDTHQVMMEAAFRAGLAFFLEANIEVPEVPWIAAEEQRSGAIAVPSATWRFHPLARRLRDECASSQVLSVHHQYASYLPNWHPWEQYDDFYAGRDVATCAAREMVPFELDPLTWILGGVEAVSADRRRAREWRTNIVDTYLMNLSFTSGIYGTVTVELHQRVPARVTRVGLEERTIVLDASAGRLTELSADGSRVLLEVDPSWEPTYKAEMRGFVEALTRGDYPKRWAEERHLYDVLAAAEESASTGGLVRVAPARG